MRSTSKLILVVIAIYTNGCSMYKKDGPAFNEAMKPKPNNSSSIVYFYRVNEHDRFSSGALNITINDKDTFELTTNVFAYSILEPGEHTATVEWEFWDKPLLEDGKFDSKKIKFKVESGKTYYFNYSIKLDDEPIRYLEKNSLLGKILSHSHVLSAGLELESEDVGLKKITSCKHLSSNEIFHRNQNEHTY